MTRIKAVKLGIPVLLITSAWLFAGAANAAVLGTATNQDGTVIEFSDGRFPQACGDLNTARVTSAEGKQLLACYQDNGHVITVTLVIPTTTGSRVLETLSGRQSSSFRLGPRLTVPTTAVAWSTDPALGGWITPAPAP